MYEAHFGLRQRPFRAVPDSESYYPATGHEQALAQVLQVLAGDEGLALVVGEPGTGKTVFCHILLDRLGDDVTTAFLLGGHYAGPAGLLQAVLYDLGLPYQGLVEQELRLALTDFVLKNYEAGKRTVLVVDEAHLLTTELLDELRLLGNLEGSRGKAVQVVLVGQPSLLGLIEKPELAVFCQRLAVRAALPALGWHEAADYLLHLIRLEGGKPEAVLSEEALKILARGTGGVPRLLNRAANQALTLAFQAGESCADAEAALEALNQLGLSDPEAEEETVATDEEATEPVPAVAETDRAAPRQTLTLDSAEHTANGGPAELPRDSGRVRRLFAVPRRPA